MILFNVTNCKGESPMYAKRFILLGDGESLTLTVDLERSPVGMEFRGGKTPHIARLKQSSGREVERLDIEPSTSLLKFEFGRPLAKGESAEVDLEFFYRGEE